MGKGETRGSRRIGVARLAIAGLLAVAGTLVAASACLPDLDPLPPVPEPPPVVAAARCGDGLIETLDDGGDAGESCDPGEAGAQGCERCQVACAGRLDVAASGHCYFLAGTATSFDDAVALCRTNDAHLVTIASARESDLATAVADGGPYWINLSVNGSNYAPRSVNEPGYPKGGQSCTGCYAVVPEGGAFEAVDGGAEDPNCLLATAGRWLKVGCGSNGAPAYQTLCEREPAGQRAQYCSGPFCTTLPITVGLKRYVISLAPATADVANEACKAYEDGGLVTFSTQEEREALAREISLLSSPFITFWIGLSSTDDGGTWTWDDSAYVDASARPLPWAGGQPTSGAGVGRAFVRLDDRWDTQLARSTDEGPGLGGPGGEEPVRAFVCQRR